ncbi:unnamed protein product [Symbiodinium sp. CCMP2592]|nr:unnamed protein product [Symbiodinium sp. CCMP2592]
MAILKDQPALASEAVEASADAAPMRLASRSLLQLQAAIGADNWRKRRPGILYAGKLYMAHVSIMDVARKAGVSLQAASLLLLRAQEAQHCEDEDLNWTQEVLNKLEWLHGDEDHDGEMA